MIIGLSGYAQTGKDTVAKYLVKNYGFQRVAFADPIREAIYKLNPRIQLADSTGVSLAHAVDTLGWEDVKRLSEDARGLLQRMGTEVGRDMFGTDFWVHQAFKNVHSDSQVVFTDVRFPNEYDKIKSYSGKIFRVEKPGVSTINAHVSEKALDNFTFDGVILNDGSIEQLHEQIDLIMKNL